MVNGFEYGTLACEVTGADVTTWLLADQVFQFDCDCVADAVDSGVHHCVADEGVPAADVERNGILLSIFICGSAEAVDARSSALARTSLTDGVMVRCG